MKPRVNVDLILVQVRVVHELLQDLHLAAEHLLYLIYLLLTSETSTMILGSTCGSLIDTYLIYMSLWLM